MNGPNNPPQTNQEEGGITGGGCGQLAVKTEGTNAPRGLAGSGSLPHFTPTCEACESGKQAGTRS